MQWQRVGRWSYANWFVLILPLLAAAAYLMARTVPWAEEGAGFEAALLFDVCVTLPLLYALCYRRALRVSQLAIRCLGLACLGIFLLGYIVPPEGQSLLPSFGIARWIGIGVLVLIELRLLIAGIRLVFFSSASLEELQAKTGAPPLLAKMMLIEARFWKAVWRLLRRK